MTSEAKTNILRILTVPAALLFLGCAHAPYYMVQDNPVPAFEAPADETPAPEARSDSAELPALSEASPEEGRTH